MTVTHAGLRAWAKGLYPLEAAVELLVRFAAGRFATPGNPWIQPCDQAGWWWLDPGRINDDNLAALSGGEQRILRIVASLADGEPADLGRTLPGLDRETMALVLAAMAHANGSHDHVDIRIDHEHPVSVLHGRLASLHPWPDTKKESPMTSGPRPIKDPLPDLPLTREELPVRIERRHREGASRPELRDLRSHDDEMSGQRRS